MSTKDAYETAYAGGKSDLLRIGFDGRIEKPAKLGVSEPAYEELAMKQDFKDLCLIGRDGTQRAICVPLSLNSSGDGIKNPVRWVVSANYGERFQIAFVGSAGQLGPTVHVGNALAHRYPIHLGFAVADGPAVDLKSARVVDRCLDPQYDAFLVVHFDRVLFNPVFYPNALDSSAAVADELACEASDAGATAKKAHNIFGAEVLNRVPNQFRIYLGEGRSVLEDDIGGVFTFSDCPVISVQIQAALGRYDGIEAQRQCVEDSGPLAGEHIVSHLLGLLRIINAQKAIACAFVSNASLVHLAREPLPPVDADLDWTGEPTLQSDMHEAEFSVNEVEVEVQAFPFGRDEFEFLGFVVLPDGIGHAQFNTRQDANQTGDDVISFHDAFGDIFLGGAWGSNILERTSMARGKLLGVVFDPSRLEGDELSEVFQENMIDG